MFKWLAIPLGYLMNWCYLLADSVLKLPLSYVFAMLFFALLTKILQFPLAINQQKSSAKMAAIQPLMQDIQKKFAKDKQRQQAETQKLQEQMGYNPMSGCLPMVIQMVLMFGLVEVIYAPLTYMLRLDGGFITRLGKVVTRVAGVDSGNRLFETSIIEQVKTAPEIFGSLSNSRFFEQIQNLDMSIGTINLWSQPSIKEPSLLWLMPLFSIVMMLLSTLVNNRMNKAATAASPAGGTGKIMTFAMVGVSAMFSFMWPVAFSLYWGFQSLIAIGQTMLLRKVVNTDKIKEDTLKAYEESKKAAKGSKKITVKDRTGKEIEKEISGSELAKLRLQKAREIDLEKYEDEEIADIPYVEYEGKKTEPDSKGKSKKEKKAEDYSENLTKEEKRQKKTLEEMYGKEEKDKKKK